MCSGRYPVPRESAACAGQARGPGGSSADNEILPDTCLRGVLPQKAEGREKLFLLLIAVKTRHPTPVLRVPGWSRERRPYRGPSRMHSEGRWEEEQSWKPGDAGMGAGGSPP